MTVSLDADRNDTSEHLLSRALLSFTLHLSCCLTILVPPLLTYEHYYFMRVPARVGHLFTSLASSSLEKLPARRTCV